MLTRVDWISFSVHIETGEDTGNYEALYLAAAEITALSERLPDWLDIRGDFEVGGGRAPYRDSWRWKDQGVTIFTHPALSHALIEISGRGCERLHANGFIPDVLRAVRDHITRLDLASDIRCDVRPKEFEAQRHEGRFKSRSEVVSESGETIYIGARSSNRYARVYRYNAPHERSEFLRVEHVVKSDDARISAAFLLEFGEVALAAEFGRAFGWEHPLWSPDAPSTPELEVYRPDRKEGKTLFWLAESVAPCLVRLSNDGVLDLEEWLDTYVRPRIIDIASQ